MILRGIKFDMEWRKGTSPYEVLPRKRRGIYCEVFWSVRGIRIGQAMNIFSRHRSHGRWMLDIQSGKIKGREGRPMADHARDWGELGYETFVLSTDLRLANNETIDTCENELHSWAKRQTDWKNFNSENGEGENYGKPVIDEVAAAKAWGVSLSWTA
jgi:hypothetical protein